MKAGTRVVSKEWGKRHGVIVKASHKTALVLFDSSTKPERVYLDTLRRETAEDVSRRQREVARRAWLDRRPSCRMMVVMTDWNGNPEGVALYRATSPEDMRAASAELLALADWFAERPGEP